MNSNFIYIILWVLFPVVIFSLLLGYRYFKSKENMALIAKGESLKNRDVNKNAIIVWASIFIGISIGIIVGVLTMQLFHVNAGVLGVSIITAFVLLCLGIALLLCYSYLKKTNSK